MRTNVGRWAVPVLVLVCEPRLWTLLHEAPSILNSAFLLAQIGIEYLLAAHGAVDSQSGSDRDRLARESCNSNELDSCHPAIPK
jgi:hypothetical protein